MTYGSGPPIAGLPEWSWKTLTDAFTKLRDARYFPGKTPAEPRRLTWLYPDDGCYARAAEMIALTKDWLKISPPPKTVFSFPPKDGTLVVDTANAPGGKMKWGWHVAPIVSSGGKAFVLDPALNPYRPLRLDEWLSLQGKLGTIRLSLCDEGAYTPIFPCTGGAPPNRAQVQARIQNVFLPKEWERQVQLGRDPAQVLGPNPPWAAPAARPHAPSSSGVIPSHAAEDAR